MGLMQGIEVIDPASADAKPRSQEGAEGVRETRRWGSSSARAALRQRHPHLSPEIVSSREIDDALAVLEKAFAAVG